MIDVKISGIEELSAAVRAMPSPARMSDGFRQLANTFSDRLRAATPPGLSGRLGQSVIWSADASGGFSGYESGVETSGTREASTSAISPQTRGRSVFRRSAWVTPDALEIIADDVFSAFSREGASILEGYYGNS